MKIDEVDINLDKIHFLTNGKTVFMRGTRLQPFFIQLYGEYTNIADFLPTHWSNLPELPEPPKE